MMPHLNPSIKHIDFIPALLEMVDPALASVISLATPFYAISPIITIFSHNVTSYQSICVILDYVFASRNMAIPIYLYASIVQYRKSQIMPLEDNSTGELDHYLVNIIENLPDDDSVIFDITSLTTSLLEKYPPQILAPWNALSQYSVLKTTAAPPPLIEEPKTPSNNDPNDKKDIDSESINETTVDKSFSPLKKDQDVFSDKFDESLEKITVLHTAEDDMEFYNDDDSVLLELPHSPTLPTPGSTTYTSLTGNILSDDDNNNITNSSLSNFLPESKSFFPLSSLAITSPTRDEKPFEQLSFPEKEEQHSMSDDPKKDFELGSVNNQIEENGDVPSYPHSMSSSVTSIFDVSPNSHSSSVMDSFLSNSSKDNSFHPQTILEEQEETENNESDVRCDTAKPVNEEKSSNLSESLDSDENTHKIENDAAESQRKVDETEETLKDFKVELQEEGISHLLSGESIYTLDSSRELLTEQVLECNTQILKENEIENKRRAQIKACQANITKDEKKPSNTEVTNNENTPAKPIFLSKLFPSNVSRFVSSHGLSETFPNIWTESASLVYKLVSTTRSACSVVIPVSPARLLSSEKDKSRESASVASPRTYPNLFSYLVTRLYPTTFVSISIYVGVFGILVTWYFNGYSFPQIGKSPNGGFSISQFKFGGNPWITFNNTNTFNIQYIWTTMVARYFH